MNVIKFSEPWDKLKNGERYFTTIRSSNPEKKRYYESQMFKEFNISLKGKIIGTAKLESIQELPGYAVPGEILDDDVKINGEINKEWWHKIEYTPHVLMLYLGWVKKEVEK